MTKSKVLGNAFRQLVSAARLVFREFRFSMTPIVIIIIIIISSSSSSSSSSVLLCCVRLSPAYASLFTQKADCWG
jgi:hypothetical protein